MRAKLLEDYLRKRRGSERKEDKVRESYALLRVMFEQSSSLMGLLKPNGIVLDVNPTALSFIGCKKSDVIGKLFWETPWWTHAAEQQERLREAIGTAARGEFIRFETNHPTVDGDLIFVDFSLKPVRDDHGNVVLLLPEGRDITERKKAEESLRENYALLRVMFDQSSLLMGLLKPDGVMLDVNPMALSFIGGKKSDVVGKLFWETPWWTHAAEQQERLREAIKDAARGEFIRFETNHPTVDGKLIYLDFSLKPVKDGNGKVVLLLPEGRDITERKKADESLREAAVKYRIVADNTYNWEFWLSPQGKFLYNSPSCQRISGHQAEEFDADPALIWDIVHPDDRQLLNNHRHDIAHTKALGELEFRIIRADGELRWIHHVCQPVFDDSENYLGVRGSFSDITSRKRAEEKNLRLAAIVETSDDAIISKSVDGIITSWNKGAEKIFNYTESEVLGKSITMLIPAEYVEEVLQMHERILRGEHVEHFETVRRRKDGELINMSVTYSPIKDAHGRVVAISAIGRDITEQKRAARILLDNARINRELEIAKEIQQSFLPVCPSELQGMLMTCRCVPAAHVGGDYYDFFPLDESIVDAVIADVTGHSVGSSLLMTMARSVLKARVGLERSPGELLAEVNNLLHDDLTRAELQISMFYARLDTQNHSLVYANAGHNRPLLFRCNEDIFMELDADGLLMGVKTDVHFEEITTSVDAGDILVLCTDGIIEAEDSTGKSFGVGRLSRFVAEYCERHPREIMAAIFQELTAFTLADDVAMIIFKIV
ncbi:PAS domain S-box protein [Desulfuromonas sp. TF]|uniref:PAS domain S-box protein n=1 Tax=Desulfuromonas sp. TF TaxID=1232410 RepID=UPI0004281758|nr:PAS domain S-box protein [Desulfuromonas sp. TF]